MICSISFNKILTHVIESLIAKNTLQLTSKFYTQENSTKI